MMHFIKTCTNPVLSKIFLLSSVSFFIPSMIKTKVYFQSKDIQILKILVPQNLKKWVIPYPNYSPSEFSFNYKNKPWADPLINDDPNFKPKWNELDNNVNRKSHLGPYQIENNYPLNPLGRTGICGKGILGRWGPNHAADPVVTRWFRNESGQQVLDDTDNLPILQFIGIQRSDTKNWAIPGGMVDPGESLFTTLRREFCEEALNNVSMKAQEKDQVESKINHFFDKYKTEIYRGPVDDPRNTDNAWIETVVYHFHDEDGSIVGQFKLEAGDDATAVRWINIDRNLELYANHLQFIEKIAHRLKAHW